MTDVPQRAIEAMKLKPKIIMTELAKELGVGVAVLQRLEKEKKIPRVYRLTTAEKIARQKATARPGSWHGTRFQAK